MQQDTARKPWTSPKLAQLRMVSTAIKGNDANEDVKSNMFMTPTGMAS